MASVYLKPKESTERLIRRFIKKVKREGIVEEVRERRYYKKPSVAKRLKREKAAQRRLREERKAQKSRDRKEKSFNRDKKRKNG